MGNIFCPPAKDAALLTSDDCSTASSSPPASWSSSQSSSHRPRRRELGSIEESPRHRSVDGGGRRILDESAVLVPRKKNRSPFREYEVLEKLGVGSMGEVSKVKRRERYHSSRSSSSSTRSSDSSARLLADALLVGGMFQSCRRKMSRRGAADLPSLMGSEVSEDNSERKEGGGSLSRESSLPRMAASTTALGRRSRPSSSSSLRSSGSIGGRLAWDLLRQDGRRRDSQNVYYALKSIHLKSLSDESFTDELRNEIEILRGLDHPNIVRAIETYEHRKRLFLVLELCAGGDLYARDPYTEGEAARIVGSILSAVAYMHSHGVVHRDLKYENIMFVDSRRDCDVKIIDFGLSKKFRPGDPYLKTGVGTIYSMAPEVFRSEYTTQADVWSVGVMAYMLLSSHLPFYGKNRRQVISRIVHGHLHFKGHRWGPVSRTAQNFVSALLLVDPDKRPTAARALASAWLTNGGGHGSAAVTEAAATADPLRAVPVEPERGEVDDCSGAEGADPERIVASSLAHYASYPALKKLTLLVVAHRSTSMEIGFLQRVFHGLDGARNGCVSKAEFGARLAAYGYSAEELDRIFDGVDLDGNGLITYTEFLAAAMESNGRIGAARLAEAFDHFDHDGCGYISIDDLRAVLGEEIPRAYIDRVIDEAALTGDHRISYEDFLSLWQ